MAAEFIHNPVEGRSCGECTACCTAVAVEELKKPIWVTCQHVAPSGCSIYAERPESCRAFECLWRSGWFGIDRHRPDKFGVIMEFQENDRLGCLMLKAWEVRSGALDAPAVRYALERMARRMLIWIFPFEEKKRRQAMGPEDVLVKITEMAESGIGGVETKLKIRRGR